MAAGAGAAALGAGARAAGADEGGVCLVAGGGVDEQATIRNNVTHTSSSTHQERSVNGCRGTTGGDTEWGEYTGKASWQKNQRVGEVDTKQRPSHDGEGIVNLAEAVSAIRQSKRFLV